MFCTKGQYIKTCKLREQGKCKEKVCIPWEDRDKPREKIGKWSGYSKTYQGFQNTKVSR